MAALTTENIIEPFTESMTQAIKNSSTQKIPGFHKLVLKGNKFEKTIQISEYFSDIENEFTVHGITQAARKKAAFVHHVGHELWIQAKAMPESTDNQLDAYQKMKLQFEQAFCMTNPEDAARNAFDEFEPERNEFVYQGYIRLHRITNLCNFGGETNDKILRKLRQKYVRGKQNLTWRENSRDMNFGQAIAEARRLDSDRAEIEMLTKSDSNSGHVNSVQRGKRNGNGNMINSCKFCSKSHKYGECPAYGQTCHTCHQQNHFSSCCPKNKSSNRRGQRGSHRGGRNHQNHHNSSYGNNSRRGYGKRGRGRGHSRGYRGRQGNVRHINEETNDQEKQLAIGWQAKPAISWQPPTDSFADSAAGHLAGRVNSIQLL